MFDDFKHYIYNDPIEKHALLIHATVKSVSEDPQNRCNHLLYFSKRLCSCTLSPSSVIACFGQLLMQR